MKLALVTRFLVIVLVAALAFGPAAAFAAPMMDAGQSAALTMAMPDDQTPAAQSGCTGCPGTGMAKAAMAVYCNAGCIAPVALPSVPPSSSGLMTKLEWIVAFSTEHSGVAVGVEPYPPNFSS